MLIDMAVTLQVGAAAFAPLITAAVTATTQ